MARWRRPDNLRGIRAHIRRLDIRRLDIGVPLFVQRQGQRGWERGSGCIT
ncbi:MAG: hypothetical protein ACKO7Z_05240 [Cyanobacteriota bacterium]